MEDQTDCIIVLLTSIIEGLCNINDNLTKIGDSFLAQQSRIPERGVLPISATIPFAVDRKERKHLFINNPVGLNILVGRLGSDGNFTLGPNEWFNVGHVDGTSFFCTSTATLNYVCTDEIVP